MFAHLAWLAAAAQAPLAGPAAGPTADPAALPAPPIVVVERARDDRHARRETTGSRLPRQAVFAQSTVATNTGTPGLTPGSGMTPHSNHTRTIRSSECVADRDGIGEAAACRLALGRRALDERDHELARGLLVPLAEASDAPAERFAAAELLAISAEHAEPDLRDAYREEALLLMVASGGVAGRTKASLLRRLAGLARARGDDEAARDRYAEAARLAPDGRTLGNLAILERRTDAGDGVATMRQALALLAAEGRPPPAGWSAFAGD